MLWSTSVKSCVTLVYFCIGFLKDERPCFNHSILTWDLAKDASFIIFTDCWKHVINHHNLLLSCLEESDNVCVSIIQFAGPFKDELLQNFWSVLRDHSKRREEPAVANLPLAYLISCKAILKHDLPSHRLTSHIIHVLYGPPHCLIPACKSFITVLPLLTIECRIFTEHIVNILSIHLCVYNLKELVCIVFESFIYLVSWSELIDLVRRNYQVQTII